MWLYDFYIKHFEWLSNLTRADKFIFTTKDGSILNDVPVLIWKTIVEVPFFMFVFFMVCLFGYRILFWMIGCWSGMAENIYK